MWCFFVFEKLAEQSLTLMGWQIDNHWDLNINQCVMIAAPHTSNWDALYARLALKALGVNVRITIKDSYIGVQSADYVTNYSASLKQNEASADKVTDEVWATVAKNNKDKIKIDFKIPNINKIT